MSTHRRGSAVRLGMGIAAGLFLHGIAGWWTAPGLAQVANTTQTTSITSGTSFESPPTCSVVGSSRIVETVTLTETIGPACIGVGSRDVANPSPACGGLPPVAALDPSRGTVFLVPAGTLNVNEIYNTQTFQCVAVVPVLPMPALLGLGGVLSALGAWHFSRRRPR